MRGTNCQVFSHTDNLGPRDGRENSSRFDFKHQSPGPGRPAKATQDTYRENRIKAHHNPVAENQ